MCRPVQVLHRSHQQSRSFRGSKSQRWEVNVPSVMSYAVIHMSRFSRCNVLLCLPPQGRVKQVCLRPPVKIPRCTSTFSQRSVKTCLLAALCRWRRRSVWRVNTRHFRVSPFLCRSQPKEPFSWSPKNASITYSWWAKTPKLLLASLKTANQWQFVVLIY